MKKIINILLLLSALMSIQAQESSIEVRELLVEKEYNNEIYDVNPLFDYASILTPKRSQYNFDDSLSQINMFTPDVDVTIQPIAYKTLVNPSGHKGFIKLDKGLLNPIHGQGAYVYSAPNYFNVNVDFAYDHRNENNVALKYAKNLAANVGMEYYLTNELKSEIEFNYDNQRYGIYGSPEIEVQEGAPTQIGFNLINGKLAIQTYKSLPSKWNFGLQGSFSNWKSTHANRIERNIKAVGKVEFMINDDWGIFFTPAYNTSISKNLNNTHTLSSSLRLVYNGSNFYLRSGARLDYINKDKKLWPDVDLRWNITDETVINMRATAQSTILGSQTITSINPYSYVESEREVSYFKHLDGDIASSIGKDFALKIQIGYLKSQSDINFIPSVNDVRLFTIETVDYERLRLAITAERQLWSDQITTSLAIQYDRYTENMMTLYYRPTLTISPSVQSNFFNNKLIINVAAHINNPQTIDRIPAPQIQSEWRKDLSGSMTFRISDQININFNADNIFDNSYQVWNGYDNFGRNLSGGVLVKF